MKSAKYSISYIYIVQELLIYFHSIFSADNLELQVPQNCSVNITVDLKLCGRNVVKGMK